MLETYIPILGTIIVGAVFGIAMIKLHEWLGPRRANVEKASPYESGMEPVSSIKERHTVKFYLVAILFILFDLEIAFLFPWATILREIAGNESMRLFGFFEMVVFLGILLLGYVYVWKKGALDWE